MLRTILGLGKRSHADQPRTPGRARTKRANRWVPQLEALEDRYLPTLIGIDWSHPDQVWFNFDNQANDVRISASFYNLLGGKTTVQWWTGSGFDWKDVFFDPTFQGGDPTIVLNMGTNPDYVSIYGNANRILVQGNSLHETVTIGNSLGNLQDVRNTVTVTNPPQFTDLTINDSGNPAAKSATLTSNSLTGLAPAAINFNPGDLASLTIRGGTGNNTFTVADTPWSFNGCTTTLKNDSGSDTITVQSTTGPLLVMNNIGSDTITLQKTTGPVEIDGGMGWNKLVGPNANTVWLINGFNTGTVNAPVFASPVKFGAQFSASMNLASGSATNMFTISDAGWLTGWINGGAGSSTLDYSTYTQPVVVNLQFNFATAVGSVAGIQNVVGSNVAAPASYNLLIGASGATLTGGTGRRNILVAGTSPATLKGGTQDDLIIAGSTIYDNPINMPSWLAIAKYWATSAKPLPDRMSDLLTGNGVPKLDNTTVTGNAGGNKLVGQNEKALIYSDGMDAGLNTFDPVSQLVLISP